MSFSPIGDLRQHFLTTQSNSKTKTELNTLVQELTTGLKSDLTEHLGSSQTALSSLNRQLAMLDGFASANTQTSQMLSIMQSSLSQVDTQRSNASVALFTIDSASSPSELSNASSASFAGLEASISALNIRVADRAVFGGDDLTTSPLVSAEEMLENLREELSGFTELSEITLAIDDWFDSPSGGFSSAGFQGSPDSKMERLIASGQSVEIDARADDGALKSVLKGLVKGVLATDSSLSIGLAESRELQQSAAVDLLSAGEAMATLQGRVGFIEGQVEEMSARNAAEQTSLSIFKTELTQADPFETATQLEAVKFQLETQYTLTSRLSGLSLVGYLR